jgi:hypothetical protein
MLRSDSSPEWPVVPTRQEEIERLAALALAPLVEVAWADGRITPAERAGVLEAAKRIGLDQNSDFCRSTLRRWLQRPPPTEALEEWRRLLVPTLAASESRLARMSERRLVDEATRIAKMDQRPFDTGSFVDASVAITKEERRVLEELAAAIETLAAEE